MQSIFSPLEHLYKTLYLATYDITGNYGIALILLSLFIYIVLFPFNQKAQQIQNLEREVQSIIAPQITEIKKKYHGKEQYEKIQRLYHRYAYHPIYAIRSAAGIVFQIPFFVAARSMLYGLQEIKGVQWGIIQNLGEPDQLLWGINLLPFVMTLVTVLFAFVMPKLTKKEIAQTIIIGIIFLIILYPAPSALLIFWTWNLLWSLLHCVIFNRFQWANDCVEDIKNYISDNELAFQIIFAFTLTVGLFVPLEIYIKNASKLWFEIQDVLKYFLSDTVKYFGILALFYVFCWNKKVRYFYLSLLMGLLIGIFLQSYIISIDYGVFDGHEIKWEEYTWQGIVNTFAWLVCLGESFIVFRRMKFDKDRIIKYVKPIVFGIIVIQCAVLVLTIRYNPIQRDFVHVDEKVSVLTTDNMYSVSAKDNIIIFLLDAFDASVFEEVQKNNPEVIDALKGFTYYPDTTSSFGFTHYSLPEILTGKLYNPCNLYSEYLTDAWTDNLYYKKLKDDNFIINIFTDSNYVSKNAPVSNLITGNIVKDKNIVNNLLKAARFRMVPHYCKYLYYFYSPSNQKTLDTVVQQYEENDILFFTNLKKGLKLLSKDNVFQFYHLTGMHYPYVLNENAELLKKGEQGTAYKQALGSLKIVSEYIAQMKKNHIFDNAAFVILADHGYHNEIGSRPLFLVKYPHSSNKKLVVSDRPSMVAELMPMLFQYNLFGDKAYKDDAISSRVYYYESEERNGQFIKYLVNSPAYLLRSWKALGTIKKNSASDKQYKIGETIDFTVFGNSHKYKTYGWGDRVWVEGTIIAHNEAELVLQIDPESFNNKKYMIKVRCNPLLNYFGEGKGVSYRDMKLYINDIIIDRRRFKEKDTVLISCKIPENIALQNEVKIRLSITNPNNVSQPERFLINSIQIVGEL